MDASNRSAPDKELWKDFLLKQREESFDILVQRYKPKLFDVAFRVLCDRHAAEDVVQRVFIRLLQRKNELAEIESVQSWLYKAALNLSLNMKTSKARRKHREKAEQISPTVETPREAAARAELGNELDLAVEKLSDSSRIPLVLRYLHGLSYVEMGRILNASSEALRSRVRRGLKRLRRLLKGRGLLISVLAVEEGLRALPAKAASASFLTSSSAIIKAASTAGIASKAALATTPAVKGGLSMTAKTKIAIGVCGAILVAGTVSHLATRRSDREQTPRPATTPARLPLEEHEEVTAKLHERGGPIPLPPRRERFFLWGRVVDAQGDPLPGALVEAGLFEGASPDHLSEKKLVQATMTDSEGEFRFSEEGALSDARELLGRTDASVREPLHSLLVALKGGYMAARRRVDLKSPQSPYRIVLEKAPEVNGIVIWEERMEPVGGIQVTCAVQRGDVGMYATPEAEVRTEEDGTFGFSIAAEGAARVRARFDESHDLYYVSKPTEAAVTLVAGEVIPNVVLTIERGAGTIIEGSVLNARGDPVAGAKVQLSTDKNASDAAVSREDGRYRLIVAKLWPYQSYFLEDWPEKPAVSTMGEAHWGTFVVPKGGADVVFSGSYPSSVTMMEDGERREWNPRWTPPPHAPPERLVAIHRDYEIGIVEVALLGPGQIRRGVDIILRQGTRVSGNVVDDSSERLARAEITIEVTSEENPVLIENDNKFIWEQKIISATDGSFEIGFLREGSYRLTASHPDCARQKRDLQLHPDEVVEGFDFVLARSVGFIRGKVVDKHGFPWPHGKVRTYIHDGQRLVRRCEAQVEEDGAYEVTKLDPGRYSLWLEVSGDYPEPEGILWATLLKNVQAGTEGNDITVVECPAGSLRVRVVDRANQPIDSFDIRCRPLSLTYGPNAIVQDKYSGALYESPSMLRNRNRATEPGEFFLDRAAPGRYSMTVRSYRHETQSQEIEVPAGQRTEVTFVLEEPGDM